MSSVERTVLHPQAANSIGRISSFLFIMHLAFESVRGRRRDNACASRADSSGRAIATAAATAAEADESAHDQESGNSDSSPDQDIRHSAPRFSFVVRNPLASRPLGRTRLSFRRRTLCTIPASLSVVVTTELKIFSFRQSRWPSSARPILRTPLRSRRRRHRGASHLAGSRTTSRESTCR